MTAKDIVEKAASSQRIPRADGYSLFHIVCAGELEKSLAPDEKVSIYYLSAYKWQGSSVVECLSKD